MNTKRRHISRLFAVVLLCTSVAGTGFAQTPIAGKKYAIVVGINKYEHAKLPALRYAVADAAELGQHLTKVGYQVSALTDETAQAPTKANIEQATRAILDKCRSGDTVIVALAGHGVQFHSKQDAYFCSADARPFADRVESMVSLDQLYRDLDASHAGVKILLVDACRNNPEQARERSGLNADAAPRPPRGVGVLFSCSAGEMAYEHDSLKHGIFFHHVIQGLRGAAKSSGTDAVTFASLADYVSTRVALDVPKLAGGESKQSPNLKADLSGASPVLLHLGADATITGVAKSDYFLEDPDFEREIQECMAEMKRTGTSHRFHARNASQRMEAWRLAAERGSAKAQWLYGSCFLLGSGAARDDWEGTKWFRKAANQGLAVAQGGLGSFYEWGIGIEKNEQEAVKWYRKSAEQGWANGQYDLGRCYQSGMGVEQNAQEALGWYRKSAAQGSALGQDYLGGCYAHAIGVPKDQNEANRWFRAAAELGWATAQYNFALSHDYGLGMPRNDAEAVSWYRKAAAQNHAAAMWAMSLHLNLGTGVLKDHTQAVQWLRKSAGLGYAPGFGSLGFAYENGQGVERNVQEAIRLYREAANRGDAWAKSQLKRLNAE